MKSCADGWPIRLHRPDVGCADDPVAVTPTIGKDLEHPSRASRDVPGSGSHRYSARRFFGGVGGSLRGAGRVIGGCWIRTDFAGVGCGALDPVFALSAVRGLAARRWSAHVLRSIQLAGDAGHRHEVRRLPEKALCIRNIFRHAWPWRRRWPAKSEWETNDACGKTVPGTA